MAMEQGETDAVVGEAVPTAGTGEMPPYNPELSYRAFPNPRIVDRAGDESEGKRKRRSRVARVFGRALDALP